MRAMFTPNCEGDTHYIKNYQTTHFKYVQFTVCRLHLKRTTFKKLHPEKFYKRRWAVPFSC